MKLFDENYRFSREASDIEAKAVQALEKIARPYLAKGASIREIAHILFGAVTTFECETILGVPAGKTLQEHMTEN